MAEFNYTAGSVMDASAAFNNDVARSVYTYEAQLPYLKAAMKELREIFELNNVPITNKTSAEIDVDAGDTVIAFDVAPAPELPDDLIEIQQLWERNAGASQPYIPMIKQEFLPHYMEGQETNQFIWWTWNNQQIELLPSNMDNQIKIDYVSNIFLMPDDENSIIGVINAESWLSYRTAALCAEFIGENKTRADALNINAGLAIDRATGISTKGKQAIVTRRRPFRASYKRRGW